MVKRKWEENVKGIKKVEEGMGVKYVKEVEES